MAPKPKDIWGIPTPSAQDVVSFLNNAVNLGRTASGDKAAVLPGDKGVRTMGRGISMTNDSLNPYANTTKQLLGMAAGNPGAEAKFAKSLARDVAITGAAVGIGAVAGKTIKAAEQSGIPARIANKVKGETILIHGSPMNNLKSIQPSLGSARFPEENVAYGWNPKSFYPDDARGLTENATQYTGNLSSNPNTKLRGTMRSPSPGGSVYVTRAKTNQNIVTDPNEGFMMAVRGETPVMQEFKVGKYIETQPNPIPGSADVSFLNKSKLTADIKTSLKKAGVKVEPNIVEKMLSKAEAKKLAARAKKNPSVV